MIGIGDEIQAGIRVDLRSNQFLSIPLMRTSPTDDHLKVFDLNVDQWKELQDEFGKAMIPVFQNYTVVTKHYTFHVSFLCLFSNLPVLSMHSAHEYICIIVCGISQIEFHSTVEDYFRCPVLLEYPLDNTSTPSSSTPRHNARVFSDFRAVGVRTYIKIVKDDKTIYDGWIDTMNAVEYAYEAALSAEALQSFVQPHLKK